LRIDAVWHLEAHGHPHVLDDAVQVLAIERAEPPRLQIGLAIHRGAERQIAEDQQLLTLLSKNTADQRVATLLPNTSVTAAVLVAERVRREVARISIPTENGTVQFTASAGATMAVATVTFFLMNRAPGGPWDREKALPPATVPLKK